MKPRMVVALCLCVLAASCRTVEVSKYPPSLVMKFEQKECLGTCPMYSIEIHGDGSAVYVGTKYVTVHGEHRYRLRGNEVKNLVKAYERIGFEKLPAWYPELATDLPWEVYTLERDGVRKSVTDYQHTTVMQYLSKAFDTYGRGEQWSRGNRETVPALRREGFDFTSTEAGATFTRAAILGNPDVVRDFLKERIPLNVRSEFPIGTRRQHR